MGSKYDTLREHLKDRPKGEFTLSFAEIERVLGFPLPKSAERSQWWANVTEPRAQSNACADAGYDAFLVAQFAQGALPPSLNPAPEGGDRFRPGPRA